MVQPNGRNGARQYLIYRPAALQHYLQANEQPVLPPLLRPRTFLLLWLLLVLLLAAGWLAWQTPIPIRATGFAIVAQREGDSPVLVCFLSPEVRPQIGNRCLRAPTRIVLTSTPGRAD